jgi:hypothetical protein
MSSSFHLASALEALPPAERAQFINDWNDPKKQIVLLAELESIINEFDRQQKLFARAHNAII